MEHHKYLEYLPLCVHQDWAWGSASALPSPQWSAHDRTWFNVAGFDCAYFNKVETQP